jgi:hypothetical protein
VLVSQVRFNHYDKTIILRRFAPHVGGYDLHALRPEEQWPRETLYANSTYHEFAVHRVTAESIATYFMDEHGREVELIEN